MATVMPEQTYDIVVLAANNVGVAVSATDANDADRRAIDTEEDVETFDHNTEQAQKETGDRVTRLFHGQQGAQCGQVQLPTLWMPLQHWTGPVLQTLLPPVGVGGDTVSVIVTVFGGDPPGMATARRAREKTK